MSRIGELVQHKDLKLNLKWPNAQSRSKTSLGSLGMPTMIDLFAGCGGMTQGFVDQGFRPMMAVEWELAAAATYAANFGEDHIHCADIVDIPTKEIPKVDVIIGGPPCQGFSNLGSKSPTDPRNKLWLEYMRFVVAANPKVFVLENVDRFSKSTEFEMLQEALKTGPLKRWKHVAWKVVNSADHGLPQRRNRTILIASRVGPVDLPVATHAKTPTAKGIKPWVGVKAAIKGLPAKPQGTELPSRKQEFFGYELPGIFKSEEIHVGRNPTAMSLERYDSVPPGGGRFDVPLHLLPRCWAEKPTGTTDVMGRMKWDEPSLTIRTEFFKPEKGQYLHPQWDADNAENRVNRPITHQEAALIQTFPKDFLWCGTKIEIAKQIGNAVPPVLATHIARVVRDRIG